MFLPAFVLVSINRKHNSLKERVNFSHAHESAKGGNVARLGLEQEEEVSILLCLLVIGECTLL